MNVLHSTRSRLAAAGIAAAFAAPLVLTGPAFAGVQMDNPVTGVATCNTATGLHDITWTVTNNVGESVDIDTSVLSGAASGNPVFTPNPIPSGESATSVGTLPGNTVGAVVLTVGTSWVDGEFPMDASSSFTLNLTACVQVTTTTTSTSTTTTTAPTTTTTAPPAVAVVVATPKFTG
jgi:hypothetical protein